MDLCFVFVPVPSLSKASGPCLLELGSAVCQSVWKSKGSEEGGRRRRKEKESCFKTKERERKSESQCNKGRYTCEHHPGPKVSVDNGQLCLQTPPWVARKLHGPKVNWKKRWSSYRRPITYLFMFFTPCNSHLLIGPAGLRA